MKSTIKFLMLFAFSGLGYEASAQGMHYQGAVRTSSGLPLANTTVRMRVSILDANTTNATVLYWESREITSNGLGMYDFNIGDGKAFEFNGDFNNINWNNGAKFLKVETATSPGAAFSEGKIVQLTAVPMSLYAKEGGTSGYNFWKAKPENANKAPEDYFKEMATIENGSITTDNLVDNAISTSKIANDAVTTTKIASKAITADKIAGGAAGQILVAGADGVVTWTNAPENNSNLEGDVTGTLTANTLKADAVTTTKIANDAITTTKIANENVTADKLAADAVTTTKIASKAITADKIAGGAAGQILVAGADGVVTWTNAPENNSNLEGDVTGTLTANTLKADAVTTTKIANDAITTTKIANENVTADKLATDAVTTTKIANENVTADKLATDAVTTTKIANDAVTADKLATDAVTTTKIASKAITADKIAGGAAGQILVAGADGVVTWTNAPENNTTLAGDVIGDLTANEIKADAVTTIKIANNNVTADKLAADAVTTTKIANENVTANKLAADAVTTTKIANDAVTTDKIASDAVTTTKIANENVTTNKLAADAVTTTKIANDAVTTDKIASDAVTTTKIANNNVTADKLATDAVTTSKIANDAVTTDKIANDAVTTDKIVANTIVNADINEAAAIEVKKLGAGSDGQVLGVTAGVPTWVSPASTAITLAGDVSGDPGANTISANAVTTTKIANDAVTTAKIANSNVNADKLATDAVTTVKIANSNVTADKLAADAVTTAKIANDAVTTDKIASNTIVNGDIATNAAIEVTKIKAGTAGQFLSSNGTTNVWATIPAADGSETKLSSGTNTSVTGTGKTGDPYVINNTYTLPAASASTLGGVKQGTGVTIGTDGTIAVNSTGVTLTGDITGAADANTIAANAVTTAKILNANVTAEKLSAGTGTDNRIPVANTTGVVAYVDAVDFINKNQKKQVVMNGLNTTVDSVSNTNHTFYKVQVATAKGAVDATPSTLGLVKETATMPTISISTDGELAVNEENLNPIALKTSDYTLINTDKVIIGNAKDNNVTFTLASAASNKGKKVTVKKSDDNESNFVNVQGDIAGLPDGVQLIYTSVPYSGWEFISDGTKWQVVNSF